VLILAVQCQRNTLEREEGRFVGYKSRDLVDGVSDTKTIPSCGRDARCPHPASDSEDLSMICLRQAFSRWMIPESAEWVGVEVTGETESF